MLCCYHEQMDLTSERSYLTVCLSLYVTSTSFRDFLHEKYRSSTKAKKQRRKERETKKSGHDFTTTGTTSLAVKMDRLSKASSADAMKKIQYTPKTPFQDAKTEPTPCADADVASAVEGLISCANNEDLVYSSRHTEYRNGQEERRPSLVGSGISIDLLQGSLPTGAALSGTFFEYKVDELPQGEEDNDKEAGIASI